MLVYIVLFLISLFGFTRVGRSRIYYLFLLIVMGFIIASRGMSVGTDTKYFSETFSYLTLDPRSWEYTVIFDPGFAILCYYFKTYISANPLDCWAFMGVFYVLSYYFFAKKYSGNVGLAIVLFVMYDSYFIGFNIIRQCFALSCVMCIFTYFDLRCLNQKEKIVVSLLVVIISYLFHGTMFIFTLVPFLSSRTIMNMVNKTVLLAIVIGTFVINISGLAVNYAISFLNETGIDGKLINYLSHVYDEESGYSIVKLALINGFMTFVICVGKDVRNIFLLIGVTGIIVLNILGPIVMEMVRVYESLMVMGLIYFTQLTSIQKYQTTSKLYYPIMIIVMIVLCLNYISKGYGEILPYIFR